MPRWSGTFGHGDANTPAVLRVPRLERDAARVEDDSDVLPVAFVRLPGVGGRRDGGAPEVDGREEPVLQDDPRASPMHCSVDRRWAGRQMRVAVDLRGAERDRAAPDVEPRRRLACRRGGEGPVRATNQLVALAEERVDGNRRVSLRGMEDEDR